MPSSEAQSGLAYWTNFDSSQPVGDYLVMYSALAGEQQRKAALAAAERLDDKWIDDGNSRSYLLAWLMSLKIN